MAKADQKLFLEDLEELANATRREMHAHAIGLDPSPAARLERRKRVLNGDLEFFAYTYLPHHLRPPASQFHTHALTRLSQIFYQWAGAKEWWVAPRGEAKSSLITKVAPTFLVVIGLLQKENIRREIGWEGPAPYFLDYIGMLGSEAGLPAKLLEVVKVELTSNAALALDFPEACGPTKNWKIGEFTTRTGVKLESFGADQAIRGTFHGASRPKVLFGDDLIKDDEAKSPTMCNGRWDWLEKNIDYLGPPEGNVKFLGVGTVLSKNDPISRAKKTIGHLVHHFKAIVTFPKNMDLWEKCQELMLNNDKEAQESAGAKGIVLRDDELPSFKFYAANKARMEKGAVISWPAVRSLYWLMRQRAKNPKAFGTEMQGDPRSDEDKVFSPVSFWVSRLQHFIMFGACDPSMGRGETSDPSAILGGAWDTERQILNVTDALIKRRVPSKLYSDLIKFQQQNHCQAIGFENNNAYESMRQSAVAAGLVKGVALPLIPITAVVDMEVRIESLEPYITDAFEPRIKFSPGLTQLLDELDSWPEKQPGHHYDGLSALQILWMIAVTRGVGLGLPKSSGTRQTSSGSMSGFM
jgi:hypothetical protein